ncbi:phospho-sugar mutase [Lysinibacter sp. HNR]|uniref:phospho-sugar mutase n=1 Tax=Lysinibacter sp. HNR TaxID=3031408 RepID=UPI002434B681|nr:phospho-sugar mutase [Lysinibacter sp. HNR]WGD37016.1 phospho-sugar mutase [Lysinibacter sp. HNR]
MTESIIAAAGAWHDQDPDPETRAELNRLITDALGGHDRAVAELHSRFDSRLAFGTAGLRGELGAGCARMNRVLVTQAAAGFAMYLLEKSATAEKNGTDAGPNPAQPSIVIGYDGRKNSDVFARDTAEIMAGAGVRAVLLPEALPTPVLAFAVRHLGVSAGVMVTASHNPPRDNGYKVYLGGDSAGSQITAPMDSEIAAKISLVAASGPISDLPRSTDYEVAGGAVVRDYIAATSALSHYAGSDANTAEGPIPRSPLSVVYTAMHGVGWQTASRVFEQAGLPIPRSVAEQQNPDPDFPTVAFPNPEEPGAMDLSYALARTGADLIIANDPDADRLAVAIPDPTQVEGFRRLTGNEVGLLLGWRAAELNSRSDTPGGTLACTIVSSPGLGVIARAHGLNFVETLTGFKWVSRVPNLIFGYEEALGYLVNPDTIRDKDGISAAVMFLDLAQEYHDRGVSVSDLLDQISETYGHFASGQVSIRVTDLSIIDTIMARLRQSPPSSVGGIAVSRVEDLSAGLGGLPASDVLRYILEDGSRIMVRPSGTEPKLKIYIDTQSSIGSLAERRAHCRATLASLETEMRELTES